MSDKDDGGDDRVHLLEPTCPAHSGPVMALRTDAQGKPISIGTMTPAPDGKPLLGGELCYSRGDGTYSPVKLGHSGPAKIATESVPHELRPHLRRHGGKQAIGQA
jgi:hypothetical protein